MISVISVWNPEQLGFRKTDRPTENCFRELMDCPNSGKFLRFTVSGAVLQTPSEGRTFENNGVLSALVFRGGGLLDVALDFCECA